MESDDNIEPETTGKQPSAQEIPDKLIRLENQDLKKQLADLETNRQGLEQRYAEQERRLEAELQENNDISVRYADQERRLEVELQEKNDLSVRYAEQERPLEAGLQEMNDPSVRYGEQERRLEAELQEKNDLSVRYAEQERRLEAELQEKNDLSVRYADPERRLEVELQEMNDLSVRYAEQEKRLEAELQKKNDLSVRGVSTSKTSRFLNVFNSIPNFMIRKITGKQPSAQEIPDKPIRLENQYLDLKKQLMDLKTNHQVLEQRWAKLERRLRAELQEKDDLSMRLSAIIASRIKDGNTTIVDLSDENRPTKLAEYFSELYDNEWTDCFDELDSQAIEESESIRILLKILTDIFNACLQWSTEDYFLLVQRAIDRTYIGQAESITDRTSPERRSPLKSQSKNVKVKYHLQRGMDPLISNSYPMLSNADVPEDGSSDKRQESNTDPKGNKETPQKTANTEATIGSGDNAQVPEDGSSDKRQESKADLDSNKETPQNTDHTQAIGSGDNAQVPEDGSSDKRQESKADSESNEETPQNTDHTQATKESEENGHGDAPSTYPAITAEESREKDQSDKPFHDNTKNGSSSEDQHGSRKVVNQGLRNQTETHTDEMSSITEEAESVKVSENKCEAEAPSATGDGPSKKKHESYAEATVYADSPETTKAEQNGQGEEPSSTAVGSFVEQESQAESRESDLTEEQFSDNTEKGSSLDGHDGYRKEDKDKLPPREKEEVELPKDLLQPIKEIKKRRALKVLPTIHEFVRRKIPTLTQARFASAYFQTYIQKCTEFSWLAVVQDPPLVLLAEGGTKFDRKLFKEYMRRGQFVEFVVWPALLVEEGGAILSKGVAQGINKPQ